MKLAAIWTIFDSLELLEGSIKQIIDHVDIPIVCYQNQSNWGNFDNSSQDMAYDMEELYNVKPLEFTAQPKIGSHPNQKAKLLQCLQYAKRLGATHYIYLATDEYYDTQQFIKAKEYIKKFKIDTTAASMYTYFKYPTQRLVPMENYYVPFIQKIPDNPSFNKNTFPVRVDPSRCVCPIGKFHRFDPEELVMHHYSWVRENIADKLNNHSMQMRYDTKALAKEFADWEPGKQLPFFKRYTTKETPNKFNICLQSPQKV